MRHTAFITGIAGQDGSYLAELLLEKGYVVHGLKRRHSTIQAPNIEHIRNRLRLHYGDVTDLGSVLGVLAQIKEEPFRGPLEIYNLAAQSHVQISFEMPVYTAQCDAVGTLNILEAVRQLGLKDNVRFYQASTSELFGQVQEIPQRETTPFYPRSPYAVAKLYGHWIVKNYREAYGMFACSGILFNHESPRRGENFVTRKITLGVAKFCKEGATLELGNLDALRDWGHARDYVRGMWLMLQQEEPQDFVLATGEQYTVRQFVERAFTVVGKTVTWSGAGVDEVGVVDGVVAVRVSPRYFRPAEVETLLGDPTKAHTELGWTRRVTFDDLVSEMVMHDCGL